MGDKLKALMEEKQRFRNKDLRISDVADELHSNNTYLSTCQSNELKTTAFVTGYRIRYVQELMRKDPTVTGGGRVGLRQREVVPAHLQNLLRRDALGVEAGGGVDVDSQL